MDDGAEAEAFGGDDDGDDREFESLAEARAYWAVRLAEADAALDPWRQRENGNKEDILRTHVRFDGTLLDAGRRAERAVLFAARDRLLPIIGPLRKRRQECDREVKTLGRRMQVEQALRERKAKAKRRS